MPKVYEPKDVLDIPISKEIQPHIDLLPGALRLQFHNDGVSFCRFNPFNPTMPILITFDRAREMMLDAVKRLNAKKGAGN